LPSVTVEDVTKQARLAKGTFYSHFRQLDELGAAVAAEIVEAFTDIAEASRHSITDPVEVIATCSSIDVGFDLVFGIVVQTMRSASEARLSHRDVPDIVQGILRALGVKPADAESALRRVEHGLEK